MPQAQESFVASFSTAESAFEFCRAVSHSVLSPQIVEVADPGAGRFLFSGDAAPRIIPMQWSVVITAAGQPPVVERYARELGHLAAAAEAVEFLLINDSQHQFVFSRIQEFPRLVLEAAPDTAIFRIGVMPTRMPSLLKGLCEIAKQQGTGLATLTRASGIVYAAFFSEAGSEAPSAITVTAVNEVFRTCSLPQNSAQAMLEWCPTEMKTSPEVVWGPSRPDFELMRRVKNSFDPLNVLAPGRFAGGI
jgi:FAD/FMN-containing dehydrogenase